jgi:hypothetical protein
MAEIRFAGFAVDRELMCPWYCLLLSNGQRQEKIGFGSEVNIMTRKNQITSSHECIDLPLRILASPMGPDKGNLFPNMPIPYGGNRVPADSEVLLGSASMPGT